MHSNFLFVFHRSVCDTVPCNVGLRVLLRILFRNAAMFPDTSPEGLFPGDQFPCAISTHGFSTSWSVIALLPDEEMAAADSPRPVVRAISLTNMPVISIPAVKYRTFVRGVERLDGGC